VSAGALTWDVADDVRQLLQYHFMTNALRAGAVVAVVGGVVGWFVVLRGQAFVAHTLAVVGFPGAAAATLVGMSATLGYYGFAVAAALVVAALPIGRGHRGREESALVGTVQAFALASGFLFVTLYHGLLGGVTDTLFGTFLGVTDAQVTTLALVAAGLLVVLAGFGRRLLFASVDPDVADARGVRVRVVSGAFLVVLGGAVAAVSQVTGVLLVFAVLVVPAAAARELTSGPAAGIALSVAIALFVTWTGLALAYFTDRPVGFLVSTIAVVVYVLVRAGVAIRRRVARPVVKAA
jgi:zinc/manganese transport system permease protein